MEFAEMMIMMRKFIEGQTTLEIGMAIALAVVLVVVTISFWTWTNKSMVERFQTYNSSRLSAIRSIDDSNFGMLSSYAPSNWNAFSMDYSIGASPPPIPGGGYSNCSNIINAALETTNPTMWQIVYTLLSEINNLSFTIYNMTIELGRYVGAIVWWTNPVTNITYTVGSKEFALWLYNNNYQPYFNSTFYQIENQFNNKLNSYGPNYTFGFYRPFSSGWNGGEHLYANDIRNDYIYPGKALEDLRAQRQQELVGEVGNIETIELTGWADYYDCLENEPGGDVCMQQCGSYADQAQQLRQQAFSAFRNSFDYLLFSQSMEQAQGNHTAFYMCFDGCMN